MKVLLLSPPYLREYMRNARCDFVSLSGTQWYPILLGYCGALLEKEGCNVKLIDAPAYYLTHEETKEQIKVFSPDLMVIYTGYRSQSNDIVFADEVIKELKINSVFVGPYASISPESLLEKSKYVKKVVIGEFDYPLLDIVKGKSEKDILNLCYREEGKIIQNNVRDYLKREELDNIPFLSRFFKKHLDIYKYRTISEPYPFMDLMTGRGCKWGLCTYCLWVHTYIKGATYNTRSIDNVIEEFRYIEQELPFVRAVMIQDDTFIEERAVEFCEARLKANIKLKWSCYARGNLSFDTLKLMKKAGCLNLHVGYESSSNKVLKNIKKGLSQEQMTRFTDSAKRAGLHLHADFAIGFPGETIESARETIKWAKKLNPHTAQFQLMIPFPGTPFYDYLNSNGCLNSNGEPDYPDFSNEQIRAVAKEAYRSFYISPQYLLKSIKDPYKYIFLRFKAISRAIPAMFWKKW